MKRTPAQAGPYFRADVGTASERTDRAKQEACESKEGDSI